MRDTYPLRFGRLEVEARRGYLHVAVHGTVPDLAEVRFLGDLVERIMDRGGERRVLLDARGLDEVMDEQTCEGVWAWFHLRTYHQMAVVLPQELAALGLARFNMTGVSGGLPLRAFATVMDGHRWLDLRTSGERRHSSVTMQAIRLSSPPPGFAPPGFSSSGPPSAGTSPDDGVGPASRRSTSTFQSVRPSGLPGQSSVRPGLSEDESLEKKTSGYYKAGGTLEVMLSDEAGGSSVEASGNTSSRHGR